MKDERWQWAILTILTVFFGRFAMQGLASDAAMYAGLSRSILANGHWWTPQGISVFPVFFEHPPYVFQWGAMVLSVLGTSDGAARAIGALPGALALGILFTWLWRRHSWPLAFWTLIFLLTFGHYTKYAATIMLEAPLSLGALLFALGTFEYFFRVDRQWRWLGLAALGASISTASKGVVGILFCAALTPYVVMVVGQDRHLLRRKGAWFVVCGVAALLPLLLWGFMTWDIDHNTSLLGRYLHEQVLRSYSTDRGHPEMYAESWSWWAYPMVILKYGWPWWWTVPLGAWWLRRQSVLRENFLKTWSKLALSFFAVLLVAFSTSQVRLPHYLHPTYLLLAPLGGYAMLTLASRFVRFGEATGQKLRWTFLGVLVFAMAMTFRGGTATRARGQDFAQLARQLGDLPLRCEIYLDQSEGDAYELETYSLWYLRGRGFRRVSAAEFSQSRQEFRLPRIWWSRATGTHLVHPSCEH